MDKVEEYRKRRDTRKIIAEYRARRDARLRQKTDAADFKESDHPRSKNGQFAKKGQGEASGTGEQKTENKTENKTNRSGNLTEIQKSSKVETETKRETSERLPKGVNLPKGGYNANRLVLDTKEAKNMFDRIKSKNYYEASELLNSETVKKLDALSEAYKIKYGDTSEIDTPERKEMRENIGNEFMRLGSARQNAQGKYEFTGEIKKEFKAEIIIGLPAAGKSTMIANPDSERMGAFIFDSDIVKEMLPEFKETCGGAAGSVHGESKEINRRCLDKFLNGNRKGDNIIIPVIGDKTQKLFENYIDKLEKAGYDVEVKFRDTDPKGSLNRAYMRALETGRVIKSNVLGGYGDKPRQVWKELQSKVNAKGHRYVRSEAVKD